MGEVGCGGMGWGVICRVSVMRCVVERGWGMLGVGREGMGWGAEGCGGMGWAVLEGGGVEWDV